MARRIKSRKRKYLGNRTYGGGNTKNRRGKGNRGGVGRAGYHKHRWLHTIKFEGTSKKARGEKGFNNPNRRKIESISLGEISKRIACGKYPVDDNGVCFIDLSNCKILSNGLLKNKINVKALAFSKKSREKIESAGGTATPLKKVRRLTT